MAIFTSGDDPPGLYVGGTDPFFDFGFVFVDNGGTLNIGTVPEGQNDELNVYGNMVIEPNGYVTVGR